MVTFNGKTFLRLTSSNLASFFYSRLAYLPQAFQNLNLIALYKKNQYYKKYNLFIIINNEIGKMKLKFIQLYSFLIIVIINLILFIKIL